MNRPIITLFFSTILVTSCAVASDALSADTVQLNNDQKYKDALDELVKNAPPATADFKTHIHYIYQLTVAELRTRDYEKAISYARQMTKLAPTWYSGHDVLSVCLGKAGQYDEAIAEAQQAISLANPPAMHPNLVLASWEWLTGKKEEALKRVASVAVPSEAKYQRDYYGTLACFYASVGDEAKIQDAIKKAGAVDEQNTLLDFLARDKVFDPYREKDWFIKIVGKTLIEAKK